MDDLSNDILRGGSAIATFLLGGTEHRGRVYHMVENGQLPIFKIGSQICARKSTLLKWIAEKEEKNGNAN